MSFFLSIILNLMNLFYYLYIIMIRRYCIGHMQTKYLKKLKIIISSAFDSLADIGNFKAFYDKYLPQIVAKQWDGENLISITINCQADEFNSFCEQLSIATGLDQFEIVEIGRASCRERV